MIGSMRPISKEMRKRTPAVMYPPPNLREKREELHQLGRIQAHQPLLEEHHGNVPDQRSPK